VDPHLGGAEGLAVARQNLSQRELLLLLDFVPNHVAPDHPWILEHPEFFIQGSWEDLSNAPAEFFESADRVIACGRDPFFPPWADSAQLNAFNSNLRYAAVATLSDIAQQCDGVRSDMAMLLINRIFERTWEERAGTPPVAEYWQEVISAIHGLYPGFLFIAEAYWDLEWELQLQGFDYCYDKRLYDRLVHNDAESVRLHLLADVAYQGKLVRFIENHDERRAASTFGPGQARAAAVTIGTLPGAKVFHEGQLEGCQVKLPIQLGRRPVEPVDDGLRAFYTHLLEATHRPIFHDGEWQLCQVSGWSDNPSYLNLVAWGWHYGTERVLVAVNLSGSGIQARVRIPWPEVAGQTWSLIDEFRGEVYLRNGNELCDPGLYVGLEPWGFHFLRFES
jgi:glycosidase